MVARHLTTLRLYTYNLNSSTAYLKAVVELIDQLVELRV